MSCIITTIAFIFLIATIGCETVSFLTSYMVQNRIAPGLHGKYFTIYGMYYILSRALNKFFSVKLIDRLQRVYNFM